MIFRSLCPAIAAAGLVALGASPPALHAASAGRNFPAEVRRSLDEEARLIVNLLQNYHYSGRAFREIENREMIVRFLSELDSNRYVLSQQDIDYIFRRFDRTLKAVYIYKGDMQPAQEIYSVFVDRMDRRFNWVAKRLKEPFDLTTDVEIGPDDREPGKDAAGDDRRWELRLTDEVIRMMLAGRDEESARKHLARRYQKALSYMQGIDAYEVRAMFLNSIIRSFDPRSGYFSADSSREFELEMEGSVTGIGVDVSKEDGRCIVERVHPGGPADLDSDIQPGCEIVSILAEDGSASLTEAMRLREITGILRGKTGTTVTLRYRRESGGAEQEVTLTRSKVTLIRNRASGAIHTVPGDSGASARIGVIHFPSFYGGDEGSSSSVSSDVGELVDLLTARGIDGLVIDVRGNPGGSVSEANKICGLFIEAGTTIHAQPQTGAAHTFKVEPAKNRYDGPLIILTDPESASASELFAGAMRFHGRAIVVGGKTTYGKGTVQNHLRLSRSKDDKENRDWGTLRLTNAMFMLPDGAPVQQTGVPSDIVLPLEASADVQRESELDHSLPATRMHDAKFDRAPGPPRIDHEGTLAQSLAEHSRANQDRLPEWHLWREEEEHFAQADTEESVSLNFDARRTKWETWMSEAIEMARRRRELVAAARLGIEPVDIAATAEARSTHDERLRALLGDATPEPIARTSAGGIIVATTGGHLRRLRWESVPYHRYTGVADELAEAFNTAAGTSVSRDEFGLILADLRFEERPSDVVVREVIARHLPEGILPESIEAGIYAMVLRIVELDPNQTADRAVFDIPLREACRVAADWATAEKNSPETSPESP